MFYGLEFMVQNVQYLNGPPNHLIRPFENKTKKYPRGQMVGVWYSGSKFTKLYIYQHSFSLENCQSMTGISTQHQFLLAIHNVGEKMYQISKETFFYVDGAFTKYLRDLNSKKWGHVLMFVVQIKVSDMYTLVDS